MPSLLSLRARRAVAAFAAPSPFTIVALLAPTATALAQTTPASAAHTVVVTANRTPQPLSSVLADISVVERDEIERAGVTGLADLLARLPGIEISRNGGPGAATNVFLRGNEARHVALVIDGVRVDSQATGGALWEQIPLDQIDRIEVLRGPAAAVYGSDAVAGVVQLFTRRGSGAARPSAALTVGSYRTAQAQAGVSGAADALSYSLSAARGRSDGFDSRTAAAIGHNPDRDGWQRSSVQGRLGYEINAVHRVDASLLTSRLRSGYDGFVPGADDENHHSLRTASLGWRARWSEAAATRLQAGESRSTYETQPDFYRTETTLRNATLQHEQRIGSNLLTGTLERREDQLLNPATAFGAAFGGKRHQDAIGLGWRGDFAGHGVQAHVRRDRDSEFGGKSTGSLTWGWAFVPQWRATASAASSFRVPTLYQRFSEYGNPALVPESGRNVELGLRWAANGDEASLAVWRNKVTNLISFGPPGPCAGAFGCYVNVGRAELKGATLAGRTQLAGVALRGSLDWHDPRNLDTGKLLPRRAQRLATFGAETQLAGWTLGTEVQAAGRRYDNAANTQLLSGYTLVNVFVSKALVHGLVLEARIDNLGDKFYELARTYTTAGRSGQLTLRWTMP
ncbi:MAG: TonB-dependent receptor [Ideonella sp.]|nr:TonB-dependent receptor [Ideonella sp.]MCC7455428.1 TonB-dependent receptor [Nitrospira sp.]